MHPVIARYAWLALPLGILIAGMGSAAACGNGKLILEDKFNTLAPAWSIEKKYDQLTTGPDGLTLVVPAGKNVGALSQSALYKNFELCIWVEVDKADPAADDLFALRFWTPDGNIEYWAVTWTGKGWFVVNRYVGATTTAITPQIENSSPLHRGPKLLARHDLPVVLERTTCRCLTDTTRAGFPAGSGNEPACRDGSA